MQRSVASHLVDCSVSKLVSPLIAQSIGPSVINPAFCPVCQEAPTTLQALSSGSGWSMGSVSSSWLISGRPGQNSFKVVCLSCAASCLARVSVTAKVHTAGIVLNLDDIDQLVFLQQDSLNSHGRMGTVIAARKDCRELCRYGHSIVTKRSKKANFRAQIG